MGRGFARRQLELWLLAAGAGEPEHRIERVPVRLGGRVVGEIELARVFAHR